MSYETRHHETKTPEELIKLEFSYTNGDRPERTVKHINTDNMVTAVATFMRGIPLTWLKTAIDRECMDAQEFMKLSPELSRFEFVATNDPNFLEHEYTVELTRVSSKSKNFKINTANPASGIGGGIVQPTEEERKVTAQDILKGADIVISSNSPTIELS